ncbi:hypothetical protein EJ02DRAFT_466632 [Clathrospora elynae]|uniref:Uncharacterized protein n=1 Tax=Clathrospora elynae TaxID=706981 RepID=A0A6A5SNB9_9PLEO|nr:hypothetical protein EJ02DRAFT_466632 [Clathrospora elynae]
MSSPHIAGLSAYLLGLGAELDTLCEVIAQMAMNGAIAMVPHGTLLIQLAQPLTALWVSKLRGRGLWHQPSRARHASNATPSRDSKPPKRTTSLFFPAADSRHWQGTKILGTHTHLLASTASGAQVMASYFDLPPQQKAAVVTTEQWPEEQRKQLGRLSLMSPAVTQLLEDLGGEHSDSNSEEGSPSEEDISQTKHINKEGHSRKSCQNNQKYAVEQAPQPSSLSPKKGSLTSTTTKGSGPAKQQPARLSKDDPVKAKEAQPRMARFHSLRSMLFQANIQDKIKTVTQEDCRKEKDVATKWKNQHEERQMHRPTTPEKDAQKKDGIGGRIRMTMRRMTTRDVGSMEKIREDGAPVVFEERASTASSDNENEQRDPVREHDSDKESINHSDVEDLVRWVSRRDPASDQEARNGDVASIKKYSGQESLGHPDVDDLVQYVSRRSDNKENKGVNGQQTGYSDASTESDSELQKVSSEEEEDVDDLVRWISHRDGSKAGPVRRKLERPELDSDVEQHYDSDVPELGRWFKRHDDTSGESAPTTPVRENFAMEEEPERGRPRSRESGPPVKEKKHLTHDDVDELVRWVSRKESNHQETPISASREPARKPMHGEEENKQYLGMGADRESLSLADVEYLVGHARRISSNAPSESMPSRLETGDLYALRNEQADVQTLRLDQDEKNEQPDMIMDDESLSHSDVQDLIAHVHKE